MAIVNGSLLGHRVSLNGSKELSEVDLRDYLVDNPMTDKGDIIISNDDLGIPVKLPAGTTNQVLTIEDGMPVWKENTIQSETAYYYNELSQPNSDINNSENIRPDDAATLDLLLHDVGQFGGKQRTGAHDVEFDIFFEGSFNNSGLVVYVACCVKLEFMSLVLNEKTLNSNIKTQFHGLKTTDVSQKPLEITDQDFIFVLDSNKMKVINNLSGGYEIPVYMKYNYRVRHYKTLTQ